jgi:hypothetical protein
MNSDLRRVEPKNIAAGTKEAVADALLNIIGARASGAGEFGGVLYGSKPSERLSSGFLLPQRVDDDHDEVLSPIWIRTQGLDLQVKAGAAGRIRVRPAFALYVRVLPDTEDLKRRDCRLNFRLTSKARKQLREVERRALEAWWNENRTTYSRKQDHPEWQQVRRQIRENAQREIGLPAGLDLSDVTQTPAIEEEDGGDVARAVDPGVAAAIPDALFDPLAIPEKWQRLDLELPAFEFTPAPSGALDEEVAQASVALNEAVSQRLEAWAHDPDAMRGGLPWGFRDRIRVRPSEYQNWPATLERIRASGRAPVLPEFRLAWDIRVTHDWVDRTRLNVHVALENRSLPPPRGESRLVELGIFQASVAVELPRCLHAPLVLARVDPSYRYNRFLRYPALGFNTAVHEELREDGVLRLLTTWMPRYVQPRIRPAPEATVSLKIAALAQPDGLGGIESLPTAFEQWIRHVEVSVDPTRDVAPADQEAAARERDKFAKDLEHWRAEAASIQVGLQILQRSRESWSRRGPQSDHIAMVYEAWLAMNETMAEVAREKQYDEWRLFQLAFILANLPSLVTRDSAFAEWYEPKRDDTVTLLYFATGGGKSEAFLGLLTFALFFDRLRGKARGITALLRYPLRLLTIQQAQRTAVVLARAERVRQAHGYPGRPFEIGFWVGSSGSPNRLNDPALRDVPVLEDAALTEEVALLQNDRRYRVAARAWNKLPRCPFCRSGTALRRMSAERGPLAHLCTNVQCSWNTPSLRALPFYICDEDIYAYAPSVLLGTVDKLALIGHSPRTIRRVLGMFGAAPWMETATERLVTPMRRDFAVGATGMGCTTLQPAYVDGLSLFHDPFPSLIVQDEAHLLDESLGTFAGLFESMLDAMLDDLAPALGACVAWNPEHTRRRRAKVIAASATVSKPERQLEHLYQREIPAIQFPYPGPDLYHSFYAAPVEPVERARAVLPPDWIEARSEHARIYAGILTNGRPHTTTTVTVLASYHLTISTLFEQLIGATNAGTDAARTQLMRHVSAGPLQAIHRQALQRASPAELATLIDLHRIALTYVTNKKGGDQILAAESEETRKQHEREGVACGELRTRLISGGVEQGEIQAIVEEAQRRVSPGESFTPLGVTLRSIVATSAISHGVDVDELNAMFFAGLPSDVAEYIQASSRIGRTHVGFCLLIPTPQRRRDRYVIEVFDSFHRFLERMVQPAAIDRWAAHAIERIIPSLFQAYMCGVLPSMELLAAPPDRKHTVRANDLVDEITWRYRNQHAALIAGLGGFATRAIGLTPAYAPAGAPFYRNLVQLRLTDLLRNLNQGEFSGARLRHYFDRQPTSLLRPMTSLRDVDQAGVIARAAGPARRRYTDELIVDVMYFIRHGMAPTADDGDEDEEE